MVFELFPDVYGRDSVGMEMEQEVASINDVYHDPREEESYPPYYTEQVNDQFDTIMHENSTEPNTINPADLMLDCNPSRPQQLYGHTDNESIFAQHEWYNEGVNNNNFITPYSALDQFQTQNTEEFQEISLGAIQSIKITPSPVPSNTSTLDTIQLFTPKSEHQATHSLSMTYALQPNLQDYPNSMCHPSTASNLIGTLSTTQPYYSPYYTEPALSPPPQATPQQALTDAAIRAEQDSFILQCRAQGKSYKEIQRLGKFNCAESTLRGRYRALIKERHERLRKPIWRKIDEKLLLEAVETMSSGDRIARVLRTKKRDAMGILGVSWVSVKAYIRKHGGSYEFGNSTCKKKWAHMHGIPY